MVQPQALARKYDKLLKYGATEFKGTVDPLEAEQWLERMDRVFKKLYCPDEQKFEYSMSLLQGDVYDWWKTIPHRLAEPPPGMTLLESSNKNMSQKHMWIRNCKNF